MHQILSYLKYILFSRHFRGDGVHSPFVFRLIQYVFREKDAYYIYNKVEGIRKQLLKDNTEIQIKDFGARGITKRKIADIAQRSLKNKKYSQLLFRLANNSKPETILELGTSLGLTTMYLAGVNSATRCVTIEGCPQTHKLATELFEQHDFNNIETYCGNIDEQLPQVLADVDELDFVFFDANHRKEPTLDYFHQCLGKAGAKSVFVFDDIYWSKGMTEAWQEIIKHPRVKVSIDVFHMGVVFLDEELQKGNYKLRF